MICTNCNRTIARNERYHRTKKGPHHRQCPLPPLGVNMEDGFDRPIIVQSIPAKIVQEDFSGTICDPKWRNAPQNIGQAEAAIVGLQCPLCYSPLLLPTIRPPVNVW